MTTTFKKRQKEMKRMEKARMKAERRFQKKLEDRSGISGPPVEHADSFDDAVVATEPEPVSDPKP